MTARRILIGMAALTFGTIGWSSLVRAEPPPRERHRPHPQAGPDDGPKDEGPDGDEMDDGPPPPPDGEGDEPGEGRPPPRRGPGGMFGRHRGGPDGPDGPGGPGGERRPLRPLSQEQIEAMLQFAHDHFPEMEKRLKSLQKEDPVEFRLAMRRMWPHYQQLKETYAHDPQGMGKLLIEDHRLEMQLRETAKEWRDTRDEGHKKELGQKLRDLLKQQWEVRRERRKLELSDLQKRLAEQEKRLKEREEKRSEMIERQFQRLTADGDMDW